ncbi:hypothetical protein IKE71_01545 [Candidatus Saccharibacteria bacterium]|nr:hypothetical protein [Candidatus Saccharibacteria bacterium]
MSISAMYSSDGISHPVTKLGQALYNLDYQWNVSLRDKDVENLISSKARYDLLLGHLHDVLDDGEFEELADFFDFGKTRDQFKPLSKAPKSILKLLIKIDKEFFDMLVDADTDTNGYKTLEGEIEELRETLRDGFCFDDGWRRYRRHIAESLLSDPEMLAHLENVEKTHDAYVEAIRNAAEYTSRKIDEE